MARLASAAGLLLALVAPHAQAQDVPTVQPGSFATIPVRMPDRVVSRASQGLSVQYVIAASGGFRPIGSADRTLDYRVGDSPIVPLTINVPGDAPAGLQEAALLVFTTGSERDSCLRRYSVGKTRLRLNLRTYLIKG